MQEVDDQRFTNIEHYVRILQKQYKEFFTNRLSGKTNIRSVVTVQKNLSREEMNQIIYLHNHGTEDDVYGSRLYMYCNQLMNEGKVAKEFPN